MKRINMENKKTCHSELVSASNQFAKGEKTLNQVQGDKKSAFTLLVKHFRSNPLTALLRSRRSRFSQTKYRNCVAHSYGFTLAETMIVLVTLGIVVALTLPSLIRKQVETQNRTKIKKAMTTYEKAFNQMLLDNQLTTNGAILSWADGIDANCENTSAYYRKEDGSGCLFKNSGLWWFIGEEEKKIGKVLLSTKKIDENDPNQTLEKVREYAKDKDNKTAFYMTGYIDSKGILRINDKAGANEEDKEDIEKLVAFSVNRVMILDSGEEESLESDEIVVNDNEKLIYYGDGYIYYNEDKGYYCADSGKVISCYKDAAQENQYTIVGVDDFAYDVLLKDKETGECIFRSGGDSFPCPD